MVNNVPQSKYDAFCTKDPTFIKSETFILKKKKVKLCLREDSFLNLMRFCDSETMFIRKCFLIKKI